MTDCYCLRRKLHLHFPFALLLPALALAAAITLGGWQTAAAQDAPSAETAAGSNPVTATVTGGAPTTQTVSANQVNAVARELWCPLCSGVRLDACELKACAQMKDMIGEKLAEGEDVSSIKNYFVAQYGPQVLGEPPLEGFNWLAWILPVLALVAGGLFVWTRLRSSTRQAHAAQDAAADAPAATGDAYSDTYGRKLDEELKHYD